MYDDFGFGEDTLTELFQKAAGVFEALLPMAQADPDYTEKYKSHMTVDMIREDQEIAGKLASLREKKGPEDPLPDEYKETFIKMVENFLTVSARFMGVSETVEPWTRNEETSAEFTKRNYPTLAKIYRP